MNGDTQQCEGDRALVCNDRVWGPWEEAKPRFPVIASVLKLGKQDSLSRDQEGMVSNRSWAGEGRSHEDGSVFRGSPGLEARRQRTPCGWSPVDGGGLCSRAPR